MVVLRNLEVRVGIAKRVKLMASGVKFSELESWSHGFYQLGIFLAQNNRKLASLRLTCKVQYVVPTKQKG